MIIPSKKKAVGIIISKMKDGGAMEDSAPMKNEEEMDENMEAKKSIAEDIMTAMHNKSSHDLMVALEAFFQECDREPHEEGPHIESDEA